MQSAKKCSPPRKSSQTSLFPSLHDMSLPRSKAADWNCFCGKICRSSGSQTAACCHSLGKSSKGKGESTDCTDRVDSQSKLLTKLMLAPAAALLSRAEMSAYAINWHHTRASPSCRSHPANKLYFLKSSGPPAARVKYLSHVTWGRRDGTNGLAPSANKELQLDRPGNWGRFCPVSSIPAPIT